MKYSSVHSIGAFEISLVLEFEYHRGRLLGLPFPLPGFLIKKTTRSCGFSFGQSGGIESPNRSGKRGQTKNGLTPPSLCSLLSEHPTTLLRSYKEVLY